MFGSGIPRLTRLTALRGLGRFFGFTFFAIATLQVFPAFGAFCRAMEAAYDKSSLARPTARRQQHLPGPGHRSPCEVLSSYFSRRPVRLRPLIGCVAGTDSQ